MYSVKIYKSIKYIVIDDIESIPHITHAFSTRSSGISINEPYPLKLFKQALDIDSREIITAHQNHSDNICIIDDSVKIERVKNIKADALITDKKEMPIGVLTADCIPVLLCDSVKGIISAVHAGRAGTIKEITRKVIERMIEYYGSSPSNIFGLIGPGIGRCCYAVSYEIAELARSSLPYWEKIVTLRKNAAFLDLREANKIQMEESGLPAENIFSVGLCTSCNTDMFFSYRKEHGKTGRMISMLMLPGAHLFDGYI